MTANRRKTAARIAALALGATVALPALTANAAPYTAKHGDTFWKLSRQYGVPLQKLMNANPDIDPLNIYAGLKLELPLPAAKPAATPTARAGSLTETTARDGNPAETTAKAGSTTTTAKSAGVAAPTVVAVDGRELGYRLALPIEATAYSDSIEENAWGPIDYFGNPLQLGTIAVDPDVIPFGSRLYIAGYDFAGLPAGGMYGEATDAGSAIKGNRIDIYVPGSRDFVSGFGFQNVTVYILD